MEGLWSCDFHRQEWNVYSFVVQTPKVQSQASYQKLGDEGSGVESCTVTDRKMRMQHSGQEDIIIGSTMGWGK